MKKLFTSLMLVAVATGLGACGKNTTSGNKGGSGVVQNCAVNHYWNGQQCVLGTSTSTRSTFADGSTSFQMGNYQFNGNLVITDGGGYSAFLKEALGICDRNIWGYEAGLAKCSTWASGKLYVSFNVGADLMPAITFTAYPPQYFNNYFVSFGINAGGMAYNPLILSSNNTFNIINNNKGFEIRANGPWGTGSARYLIQLIVKEGTLQSNAVNYELAYKNGTTNKVFARGTMKKVQ